VYYHTIKLFFIGNGERGKTTLLQRLRCMPDEKADRTTGIDVEDWVYPEQKKFSFRSPRSAREPVRFLAWDFAGQVRHFLSFSLLPVPSGVCGYPSM